MVNSHTFDEHNAFNEFLAFTAFQTLLNIPRYPLLVNCFPDLDISITMFNPLFPSQLDIFGINLSLEEFIKEKNCQCNDKFSALFLDSAELFGGCDVTLDKYKDRLYQSYGEPFLEQATFSRRRS